MIGGRSSLATFVVVLVGLGPPAAAAGALRMTCRDGDPNAIVRRGRFKTLAPFCNNDRPGDGTCTFAICDECAFTRGCVGPGSGICGPAIAAPAFGVDVPVGRRAVREVGTSRVIFRCRRPQPTTTTAPPVATTSTTLPAPCSVDGDCDDGNPCSADSCVDHACRHECLCVAPGGAFTCCPGPAAECGPMTTTTLPPCGLSATSGLCTGACPSGSTCTASAPGACGCRCPEGTAGDAGDARWFLTCADPVCGGDRPDPDAPPCGPGQVVGEACGCKGLLCDPGSFCNERLLCTTSDPTHGGVCPISRRRYKEDIRYLGENDRRRLHDELMRFPLATYRYRSSAAACRPRLGFVIEDVEPSPSVDAGHDVVDLYGYTTMAVAALQTQARQIEALQRELGALRSELEAVRHERRADGRVPRRR